MCRLNYSSGLSDSSYDKKFWEENDLQFVGLPDPEHKVLNTYGQQVKLFKLGRMPAQVIIDKKGIVRYAHFGNSMSDIPENSEILGMLAKLNQQTFEPTA